MDSMKLALGKKQPWQNRIQPNIMTVTNSKKIQGLFMVPEF